MNGLKIITFNILLLSVSYARVDALKNLKKKTHKIKVNEVQLMWSFSLFLSSFKMPFLETTIFTSGLNSHITSTSSTLTVSFRFILSGLPGIPLHILHKQHTVQYISVQALLPLCSGLGRLSSVWVVFSYFPVLCPTLHWPSDQPHPMICVSKIFLTLPFSWYRLSFPSPTQSSCENL